MAALLSDSPLATAPMRVMGHLLSPGGERGRLWILMYHRVLPEPDPMVKGDPTAAEFEAQLQWLSRGYNLLPLDEAVTRLKAGRLPPRAVAITFDDGYADNADVALPLLRQYSVPATFFVATGFLDGGLMWNDAVIETLRRAPAGSLDLSAMDLGHYELDSFEARRRAAGEVIGRIKHLDPAQRAHKVDALQEAVAVELPRNLMMRSEQVAALAEAGMVIGAHTVTHPILRAVDEATARDEIAAGRARLRELTGTAVSLFAYPNGCPGKDYGAEHARMVKDLGFDAAVSTAWGTAARGHDPYQLPRFTPWDKSAWRFNLRAVSNYLHRDIATA